MTKNTIPALLVALCAIMLSACAGGPAYCKAKTSLVPKRGKGLVIAYWEPGVTGLTARYKVSANDQGISPSMGRGSFVSYEANPGSVVLATKRKMDALAAMGILSSGGLGAGFTLYEVMREQKNAAITVAAGKTYFMRMSRGMLTMKAEPISREKADAKIALCRWANPPAK